MDSRWKDTSFRWNMIKPEASDMSLSAKALIANEVNWIAFDEPQRAIAKRQAIVFYEGDVVLGDGTIC